MFTTSQYKPLQDLRRYVPSLDMFPVDPEVKTEITLQVVMPGHIHGLCQKSEMFSLPRPMWRPLSRTATDCPAAPPREVDHKDSMSYMPEAILVSSAGLPRAPSPVSGVSGTGVSGSILSHPELRGIRGRVCAASSGVTEASSSAYQHPTKSVSADPFPLLKHAPPSRAPLRSSSVFPTESSSQGKTQFISASDHSNPSKVPIGLSLTSSKGQQMALIQNFLPTRQYSPRIFNPSTYTLPKRSEELGIPLDLQYQATISRYLECLLVAGIPSKPLTNPPTGNRTFTFLPTGLAPFLSNKPWILNMFGRPPAPNHPAPPKADYLIPLGGPSLESFIHPRHRSFVRQFLRKSVPKMIEGSCELVEETACDLGKDGIPLEDAASEPMLKSVEENKNLQLDELAQPLSAHSRRGSASSVRIMKEPANESDLLKGEEMPTNVVENDNRVGELGQDTDENNTLKEAPPSSRRVNPFRDAVRRRMSVLRPSHQAEGKFHFITLEITASTKQKRKNNPTETSQTSRCKRTRDNSVEANIDGSRNSIAAKLIIRTDTTEPELADVNSPGRALILSPLNTNSAQIGGLWLPDPILPDPTPDPPATPTSTTCSAARWSTQSIHSEATGITVPYSLISPSSSRKLLTERAWDAEEESYLRGRQERRTQGESRLLSVSGNSLKRSRSVGAIPSDLSNVGPSTDQTRRSLNTTAVSTSSKPMFQQLVIMSPVESQNLTMEHSHRGSSESASIVGPGELEDPFIISDSQVPTSQGNLFALEERKEVEGERVKEFSQRKDKKGKFQRLREKVKGFTKKVSGAMKKEKD